jgi:cell surface protein SprA
VKQASTEFAIGAGYRKRGMKLFAGLKLPKFLNKDGGTTLDNEINFRFDFKVRDNVTVNNRLDQNSTLPTGGSKKSRFHPTIDYFLNSRVNIKLFFDQRHVTPYISFQCTYDQYKGRCTNKGVVVTISRSNRGFLQKKSSLFL